jgi:hypothetical protein
LRPLRNPERAGAVCLLLVLLSGPLGAQQPRDLPPPPDFLQSSLVVAVNALTVSWGAWRSADAGLEQRVFRIPMREARGMIEQAWGAYREFLDKRRVYSEALARYIDEGHAQPQSGQKIVTLGAVYQDQIQLLGVNLEVLQGKLDALRNTAEWVSMRRQVQAESMQAFQLLSSRRAEMPLDLSLKRPEPVSMMSSSVYRDSERQTAEALDRLWTRYYQALVDSVEQAPGGSRPLIARRPSEPAVDSPGSSAGTDNPLVGVWTYAEGSQQFNGVGEPRQVLLELWMEGGALMGRYRAELPDFQGVKKVDLRLSGGVVSPHNQLTLNFESKNPPASGRIILEGPGSSGTELMFVRAVTAQSPIPRGREMLLKRSSQSTRK